MDTTGRYQSGNPARGYGGRGGRVPGGRGQGVNQPGGLRAEQGKPVIGGGRQQLPLAGGRGDVRQVRANYLNAAADVRFRGVEATGVGNANAFNRDFAIFCNARKEMRKLGVVRGNPYQDVLGGVGKKYTQNEVDQISNLIARNVANNGYGGYKQSGVLFLLMAYRNEFSRQGFDKAAMKIQDALIDLRTPQQMGVQTQPLGKGAFNEVVVVQTKDGPKVFKPHNPTAGMHQLAGINMGIDRRNPRSEARNVLTWQMARSLGFDDCVVKTEFANVNGRKGVVMDMAPGTSQIVRHTYTYKFHQPSTPGEKRVLTLLNGVGGSRFYDENNRLNKTGEAEISRLLGVKRVDIKYNDRGQVAQFKVTQSFHIPRDVNNSQYQRQSVELGLLDWISGQTDRHAGNIIGGKGIDNDASWGSVPLDLRYLDQAHNRDLGFRNVHPPLVVDTKMMDSIWRLNHRSDGKGGWVRDDDMYRQRLSGFLNDTEVQAAVERLNQVQEHLSSSKVTKIKPSDWGTSAVTKLLLVRDTDANGAEIPTSYLGREHYDAQGKKTYSLKEVEAFKRSHPS